MADLICRTTSITAKIANKARPRNTFGRVYTAVCIATAFHTLGIDSTHTERRVAIATRIIVYATRNTLLVNALRCLVPAVFISTTPDANDISLSFDTQGRRSRAAITGLKVARPAKTIDTVGIGFGTMFVALALYAIDGVTFPCANWGQVTTASMCAWLARTARLANAIVEGWVLTILVIFTHITCCSLCVRTVGSLTCIERVFIDASITVIIGIIALFNGRYAAGSACV